MSILPDFELVSTTRYAPCLRQIAWNTHANAGTPSPYLLLRYHQNRLLSAAAAHGWAVDVSLGCLEGLVNAAVLGAGGNEWPEGDFRIRILLSFSGSLSVTASPIPSLPVSDVAASSLWALTPPSVTQSVPSLNILVVFLDTVSTTSSLFTQTKTTCRDHYTVARTRFDIPPPPTSSLLEVLLFNDNDDITETSIRNVAFIRRSPPRWVTPSASTGCLPGVMRRWLLEQGRVVEAVEGELTRDGVVDGEYVLTFNGVEGCRLGQVKRNK